MSTKKHVMRTPIDEGLLEEMRQAGEISISTHGHVFGMDMWISRMWNKEKKGRR